MTVEDCAAISHMVSALLDAEDPIKDSYVLEVSSPGIDRPLTRPRDFERFSGHVARIELRSTIDGRRRFRGRLQGIEDGLVRLETDGESVALPVGEIATAKLIMTDELLAASQGAMPEAPRGRQGGG
jgi:ribosome maturation factor RimP